jgi:hypothetical protein
MINRFKQHQAKFHTKKRVFTNSERIYTKVNTGLVNRTLSKVLKKRDEVYKALAHGKKKGINTGKTTI